MPTRRDLQARADLWIPLAAATVFLVWFLLDLRGILEVVYSDADAASAPVLADDFSFRGGGRVLLGDYRWLEALYLLWGVDRLPGHRELGELLPILIYALAVTGVAWSVAQAAGRRRGLLVGLLMACPAPLIVRPLLTLNYHALVVAHTSLLLVTLVLLVRGGAAWSPRRLGAVVAGVAAISACGVAGDQLFLTSGVIGFLAAATTLAITGALARRELVASWALIVAALVGGAVLQALATGRDIHSTGLPINTNGFPAMFDKAQIFFDAFGIFLHGESGLPLHLRELAAFGGLLLAILAVAVAVSLVRRWAPRLPELDPLTRGLVTFAAVSGACVFLSFVSTTVAFNANAVRYMLWMFPAVLIVLALLLPKAVATPALTLLLVVSVGLGISSLARGDYEGDDRGSTADALAAFAAERGLDHGYSGYWTSASFTYATDAKVRVYPVDACGAGACPFRLHRLDSWYKPKPDVSTFYVVDSAAPEPRAPAPPAEWGAGPPETIGPLTVYVFPYDVASRFGPAPEPLG